MNQTLTSELQPSNAILALRERLMKLEELAALRRERDRRTARRKLQTYYPNDGPLRRELYPKHLQFFKAGAEHNERLFMAANRVGKTEGVGAYEATLHLTGMYPDWWEGRRFKHAISAWASGQTSKTTRDIIQAALLGPYAKFGTGMIPGEQIISTTPKAGNPEAIETVYVKHVTGERSDITFKSYDQGQEASYGTRKELIWLDEECDRPIYTECLLRTMATVPGQPNGLMLFTFTPLYGLTPIVRDFLGMGAPAD